MSSCRPSSSSSPGTTRPPLPAARHGIGVYPRSHAGLVTVDTPAAALSQHKVSCRASPGYSDASSALGRPRRSRKVGHPRQHSSCPLGLRGAGRSLQMISRLSWVWRACAHSRSQQARQARRHLRLPRSTSSLSAPGNGCPSACDAVALPDRETRAGQLHQGHVRAALSHRDMCDPAGCARSHT